MGAVRVARPVLVTPRDTWWPLALFWISLALAVVAGSSTSPRRAARCGCEGGRDGGRGGDQAPPADVEPAEADGPDRRQAVHGARARPAPQAWADGGRRHARLHAAGDPHVLRRRRVARPRDGLFRRRESARHRGLRGPREGAAHRDLPRHLGRRPVRRRPHRAGRDAPREGRRGDDRPQVRRQPARVRHRRDRRRRARRAVPREALLGAGLLGHDQHGDLRARARGAAARPRRPPVRLLEGALPAPARDGPADLRPRARRLLAGRRHARAVPPGELRRARRRGAARHPRPTPPRERMGQRGGRHRPARADRRAGLHRREQPRRRRRVDRRLHRALARRDRPGGRARVAQRRRRRDLPRPQRRRRRHDHRPRVRHPRPRAHPRRRRDRRRGHDRGGGEHLPGRPHLPVQGDRDRLADPREHRLGEAGDEERLRTRRRDGPRQRRPHPGDRGSACRGARHGAPARQPRRREPGVVGRLPDDPARDHRRPDLDRRPGCRPADLPCGRHPPRPEDAGARRRRPRRPRRASIRSSSRSRSSSGRGSR